MLVVAEASGGHEAVALAIIEQPDVCLLDVHMPDGDGIQAAREIAEKVPGAAMIMLAAAATDGELFDALRAGARGYLLKDMDPDRLPLAIRGVLQGEAAVPRQLVMRVIEEFRARERRRRLPLRHTGAERLTEREWEVLELLAQDLATREIAQRLAISEVTVRRHLQSSLGKLGLGSRAEVIALLDDGG
jgi:DNA-binding NarL/FixJ family response regulator